jgi:hypothetical protein
MKKRKMGRPTLFSNKVRKPVTLTLTQRHHDLVNEAAARLGLSRADVIGLLISRFCETLTISGV